MNVNKWLREHGATGLLESVDAERLTAAARRVLKLMADGQSHDADEIRLVAGNGEKPASEGLRRLRDLRPILALKGLIVTKQRQGTGRLFVYRIEKLNAHDR